jgi:ankyrin repeat protein
MASELHDDAVAGDLGNLLVQLSDGADANVHDSNGATPLHLAVANGRATVVEALLCHGADPNATNAYGETAISDANDARIMRALLEAGATLPVKLADRLLYDAVRFGSADIIDVLREHGVRPRKWHVEAARDEWSEGDVDIRDRVYAAIERIRTNRTDSRAKIGK